VLTKQDFYDRISGINDEGAICMSVFGYHRTGTTDQHLDRGVVAITEYCENNGLALDILFSDQQTGKNFNRPDYQAMKRVAKAGDIIILTEIDRLGRDRTSTLKELQHYRDKKVRVMILEIPTTLIDYDKLDAQNGSIATMMAEAINSMLIEMFAVFAQAETEKRERRQREGILAKKGRNEWDDYGRPRVMNTKKFCAEYQNVVDGNEKPFECMRRLGLTKPTFYRYIAQYKAEITQINP